MHALARGALDCLGTATKREREREDCNSRAIQVGTLGSVCEQECGKMGQDAVKLSGVDVDFRMRDGRIQGRRKNVAESDIEKLGGGLDGFWEKGGGGEKMERAGGVVARLCIVP